MSAKLTGNTRYRTNWRGKLILQVELTEVREANDGFTMPTRCTWWRDARVEDLPTTAA